MDYAPNVSDATNVDDGTDVDDGIDVDATEVDGGKDPTDIEIGMNGEKEDEIAMMTMTTGIMLNMDTTMRDTGNIIIEKQNNDRKLKLSEILVCSNINILIFNSNLMP